MSDYAPAYVNTWEVYPGRMRVFILGVGEGAWFPVSKPLSSEQRHHSPADINLAEKACEILRERHRDARDGLPELIRSVLVECGWVADELTRYPKLENIES